MKVQVLIMIPKKIHYCWFGDTHLPNDVRKYIYTWRKFCPDYEIIEWNESNFDVNENAYCREAYEAKKWAFVTDYVRLKVLYEYGGIYMDTDVEVCKNLDPLLKYAAVSGYESKTSILTGTMAACRGNEWIEMLLRDYDNRHFLNADGSYDLTTNVKVITKLTKEKYNLILDGSEKQFGDNNILFPFDYFCAKLYHSGELAVTENTYTIHHFNGSWLTEADIRQRNYKRDIVKKLSWIPVFLIRSKLATLAAMLKVGGWRRVIYQFKVKYCNDR